MKVLRILALGLAVVVATAPARSKGGSTGLTFLTLGVGSRSLGMGDAYVSAANDPAAMQYNPATLGSIDVLLMTEPSGAKLPTGKVTVLVSPALWLWRDS